MQGINTTAARRNLRYKGGRMCTSKHCCIPRPHRHAALLPSSSPGGSQWQQPSFCRALNEARPCCAVSTATAHMLVGSASAESAPSPSIGLSHETNICTFPYAPNLHRVASCASTHPFVPTCQICEPGEGMRNTRPGCSAPPCCGPGTGAVGEGATGGIEGVTGGIT